MGTLNLSGGNDMVNHPPHYRHGGIECIDAIRAQLGASGFKAYCHGAIAKYLWRWEFKGGLEDLHKAQWYLAELIKVAADMEGKGGQIDG